MGENEAIRRVLLRDANGETKTLLEIIQDKNRAQGRIPAPRTDVRIDADADGRVYLLNKHDGTILQLVPGRR